MNPSHDKGRQLCKTYILMNQSSQFQHSVCYGKKKHISTIIAKKNWAGTSANIFSNMFFKSGDTVNMKKKY